MIKYNDEKLTAKRYAQEIFYERVTEIRDYISDIDSDNIANMTERELELVMEQIEKLENRIVKMLGFNIRE